MYVLISFSQLFGSLLSYKCSYADYKVKAMLALERTERFARHVNSKFCRFLLLPDRETDSPNRNGTVFSASHVL